MGIRIIYHLINNHPHQYRLIINLFSNER
ncbi:hypothetical protein HORM4_660138 [Vibrio harveyi]|nr:hypothetical protein HORM4_660138 [Vibrio harveyi]